VDKYTEMQLAELAAANRLAEHRRDQPWTAEIDRIEVRGIHTNLAEGLDAEELLIRTEKPKYNKIHADYNRRLLDA